MKATHYNLNSGKEIIIVGEATSPKYGKKYQVKYIPSGSTAWYFEADFKRMFQRIT